MPAEQEDHVADRKELPGVDQAIPSVAGMWDYYLGERREYGG